MAQETLTPRLREALEGETPEVVVRGARAVSRRGARATVLVGLAVIGFALLGAGIVLLTEGDIDVNGQRVGAGSPTGVAIRGGFAAVILVVVGGIGGAFVVFPWRMRRKPGPLFAATASALLVDGDDLDVLAWRDVATIEANEEAVVVRSYPQGPKARPRVHEIVEPPEPARLADRLRRLRSPPAPSTGGEVVLRAAYRAGRSIGVGQAVAGAGTALVGLGLLVLLVLNADGWSSRLITVGDGEPHPASLREPSTLFPYGIAAAFLGVGGWLLRGIRSRRRAMAFVVKAGGLEVQEEGRVVEEHPWSAFAGRVERLPTRRGEAILLTMREHEGTGDFRAPRVLRLLGVEDAHAAEEILRQRIRGS